MWQGTILSAGSKVWKSKSPDLMGHKWMNISDFRW